MIEWGKVKYFNPNYPAESVFLSVEHLLEPELIYSLDTFRSLLGHPVHPSPLHNAWVRTNTPTSQHNVVHDINMRCIQKSRAGDVFPDCPIQKAFYVAAGCGLFGGIGIYFDTHYNGKPKMMMHLDIRKIDLPMWWVRVDGIYLYAHKNVEMNLFYKAMAGNYP